MDTMTTIKKWQDEYFTLVKQVEEPMVRFVGERAETMARFVPQRPDSDLELGSDVGAKLREPVPSPIPDPSNRIALVLIWVALWFFRTLCWSRDSAWLGRAGVFGLALLGPRLSGDRGLAGGFNANASKAALAAWKAKKEAGAEVLVATVGKKGRDFLARRKVTITRDFPKMYDGLDLAKARLLAEWVTAKFERAEVDSVYIVYNEFKSAMTQLVVTRSVPRRRGWCGWMCPPGWRDFSTSR